MKNQTEAAFLNQAIQVLEEKQLIELESLHRQFLIAYESLKPINLIKNTLSEAASSSEIKKDIAIQMAGMAAGFIAKKVMIGGTHNPVKKLLGTIAQFSIAYLISKTPDSLKADGERIFRRILDFGQKKKQETVVDERGRLDSSG
jgi:hypothetical protein